MNKLRDTSTGISLASLELPSCRKGQFSRKHAIEMADMLNISKDNSVLNLRPPTDITSGRCERQIVENMQVNPVS
jgi:hypothetical protein